MSKVDTLNELVLEEQALRQQAVKAHWDWLETRDQFGSLAEETMEALAKKDALSDIVKEKHWEIEALQEEIKHG